MARRLAARCVLPLRREPYPLAPVVIVILMAVTPIPIRPLRFAVHFSNRTIRSVIFPQVPAIGAVFAVIPIVIVLVGAVVDPVIVVVLVVSMVAFLTSVLLRPGRGTHCRWCSKSCCKKKGT
jgi:hypothetical protein